MGIKVYCPNGHKLNVKSFLAGKRGVCPHCGEKFDIPAEDGESQAPTSVATEADGEEGGGEAVDHRSAASAGAGAQPFNAAVPANVPPGAWPAAASAQPAGTLPQVAPPSPSALPAPVSPLHVPGSQPAVPRVAPVTPVHPAVPVSPVQAAADPLAESPEACWYVRPPSGGQYGPAKAQIMRQWINEGRVTPDSLVWREGWPDWKLASATFPNLPSAAPVLGPLNPGAPLVQPAAGAPPVQPGGPLGGFPMLVSDASASSPNPNRTSATYRRRDKTAVRVMALAFLFIALLALTGLLVWVLNSQ